MGTSLELAVRVVVFALAFALVAWKHPRVHVRPRWALPLVALVFALLDTGLHALLRPVVDLATLGALSLVLPVVLSALFLWATRALVGRLRVRVRVEGLGAAAVLVVVLSLAHGALYLALDRFALLG